MTTMQAQTKQLRLILWFMYDAGVEMRSADISTWALMIDMRYTERDANGFAYWGEHS